MQDERNNHEDQTVIYKTADSPAGFEAAKGLFREYLSLLGEDLSFQQVEQELTDIGVQYALPSGGLLLARVGGEPAGCAGIRKLDDETAELKRMFVRERYRGWGIGYGLLQQSIALAQSLGYQRLRLDTLERLTKAMELYQAAGFYTIPPYRYNPLEGVVYMEKRL